MNKFLVGFVTVTLLMTSSAAQLDESIESLSDCRLWVRVCKLPNSDKAKFYRVYKRIEAMVSFLRKNDPREAFEALKGACEFFIPEQERDTFDGIFSQVSLGDLPEEPENDIQRERIDSQIYSGKEEERERSDSPFILINESDLCGERN